MQNVIDNTQWCNAIFRYLLENQDFADSINFRGEYFGDQHQTPLSAQLFYAMRKYMTQYHQPWSYKTMELAYFTDVRSEFRDIYGAPQKQMPDDALAFRTAQDILRGFYDSVESITQTLSEEFIQDCARTLVKEEVIHLTIRDLQETYVRLQSENIDADEFRSRLEQKKMEMSEQYKYPDEDDDDVYIINNFDSHFFVDVSDKIFPTNCKQLNNYLCGGFHTQSVTGFLTKTGGGKTTLLVTLAADALLNQQNICIVNLEMNDFEIYSNLLSSITNTRTYDDVLHHLNHHDYMQTTKNEFDKLNPGIGGLFSRKQNNKNAKNVYNDIDWLDRQVKKLEKKIAKQYNNPDFHFGIIYIDYLYLMTPKAKLHKNARPDELYRQLVIEVHQWAQDNDYAVVTVFQGNRTAEAKLNNNESITLADAGDSYAAFRDLEYAFSVGRLSDPDNDRDGVVLTPLKTRHYDGDWTSFYIPYIRGIRKYDMQISEDYQPANIQSDSTEANKKDTTNGKITVSELLDACPNAENMVGGAIVTAMQNSKKVFKANRNQLQAEFNRRGWTLLRASDMIIPPHEETYAEWKTEILQTIDRLYAKKHLPDYKLVMGDNINELFD